MSGQKERQKNGRMDSRTDRKMDRPFFIGPFRLPLGVQNDLLLMRLFG